MQRIPRRQFTDDFKSQAVALAESIGPAKAARQLDISVKTLANWVATARAGKPLSSPVRQPVSELEWEISWEISGMGRSLGHPLGSLGGISGDLCGISGTPTILGWDLWDEGSLGHPPFFACCGTEVYSNSGCPRFYNNLGRIVGVPDFSPAPIFPFPARRVTPCSEWRSAGSMVSAALCRRFSIWFSTWT